MFKKTLAVLGLASVLVSGAMFAVYNPPTADAVNIYDRWELLIMRAADDGETTLPAAMATDGSGNVLDSILAIRGSTENPASIKLGSSLGITYSGNIGTLEVDASSIGRELLTASDAAAARSAIGAAAITTPAFNYSTPSLNTCIQVSSTRDAMVGVAVQMSAPLSISSGTVYLESFTNSGCTTGTQEVTRFVFPPLQILSTQANTIQGPIPAGRWYKIRTSTGVGSPSFTALPSWDWQL